MLVRNLLSPKIDIPHEPGQWMQFRRLNARRIAECTDKRQMDALSRMKALGADGLAMIRDAQDAKKDAPKPKANPLDAYDTELLLVKGIAAWSYDGDPKTELTSDDGGLDPKTSAWAAAEILKFNGLDEDALGN